MPNFAFNFRGFTDTQKLNSTSGAVTELMVKKPNPRSVAKQRWQTILVVGIGRKLDCGAGGLGRRTCYVV